MSALVDEALAKIDHVLAGKPTADSDALTDATQLLCRRREELATDGATREQLETLNAVISVVLATHYPTGGTPWAELENARGWLAGLAKAA
jgi:hypothetical protein